jgi:undecaprenyl-diphosphatase
MSKGRQGDTEYHTVYAYLLGAFVAVFIIMAAMAAQGVGQWERETLRLVYGASGDWRMVALIVTQFGSIWLWLCLVALLFIVRRRPGAGLSVFRNGVIAYAAVTIIKFGVARPRPELLLHDVVSREVITVGLGFPSAHATIATVMALTLLPYFKGARRWLVPVGWVGAVVWSRLYLGVHAPLDVLGGIVLGYLVVSLARYLPAKGAWKPERL